MGKKNDTTTSDAVEQEVVEKAAEDLQKKMKANLMKFHNLTSEEVDALSFEEGTRLMEEMCAAAVVKDDEPVSEPAGDEKRSGWKTAGLVVGGLATVAGVGYLGYRFFSGDDPVQVAADGAEMAQELFS